MNKTVQICLFILLLPLIIVVLLAVLSVWIFTTITCIGPALQYYLTLEDDKYNKHLPSDVKLLKTPRGYKVAVRYNGWGVAAPSPLFSQLNNENEETKEPLLSRSDNSKNAETSQKRRYPIIIPNGLAATLCTTTRIHEAFVDAGFDVVSFDRYGVGYSDDNTTGESQSVDQCVEEMNFVMETVSPGKKWIVMGPSMGSIVGQAFVDKYANKVAGFLLMDGFAAAFHKQRKKFEDGRGMWKLIEKITWTGILRPFIYFLVPFDKFSTPAYPTPRLRAQMNQARFYKNTCLEFPLMLDLAEHSSRAWGPIAITSLLPNEIEALIRVQPDQNGEYTNGAWKTLPRSPVEHGNYWNTKEETEKIMEGIKVKSNSSSMYDKWKTLVVRIMSGRNYDYFGGDSFYVDEMKDHAAAEGALLSLLAKDGKRYVYPHVGHDKMFLMVEGMVLCVCEIDSVADV